MDDQNKMPEEGGMENGGAEGGDTGMGGGDMGGAEGGDDTVTRPEGGEEDAAA